MTTNDAYEIINRISNKSVISNEEEFQLTEAYLFLFDTTKKSSHILHLGGYFYGIKRFDLALKYYEMAADLGNNIANLCLGYVWYYGRTGERDYKKAYNCFKMVKEAKTGKDFENGEVDNDAKVEANLKIADMYKNGYYVLKDYEAYKRIINNLYKDNDINKRHNVFGKYVEVGLRKARILEEKGKIEEAINIYYRCRYDLAIRLAISTFFGDVNQMNWTINDIYRLVEFDPYDFDLYDLFFLLKEEHVVSFMFKNKTHIVESKREKDEMVIRFDDKWYRNITDFFNKAALNDELLLRLENDGRLSNWMILK